MDIIEAIRNMKQGAKMEHKGTKLQLGDAITLDNDIVEGWEVVEAKGQANVYEEKGCWHFRHHDKRYKLHEATSIVGFDSIVYERGVPIQVVFES